MTNQQKHSKLPNRKIPTTMQTLDIGKGQTIELPNRTSLIGGLKIKQKFSSPDTHPYDLVDWELRDIAIYDYKKKKNAYQRSNVEVPKFWAENAAQTTVSKYLFGNEEGTPEYEDSLKHAFDRIANTYTIYGWKNGYFATLDDAKAFNWELKAMLVNQMWAPNSPVWFNIGHWEQWRWGRPDLREGLKGKGNKSYKAVASGEDLLIKELDSTFEQPQCSACFLTGVEDSMEEILQHQITEGRIFASGSGVGINLSTLRSSHEPISGKGKSSGPISFDRGWDKTAGAIKSGGKTRRAARMTLMDSNHPDIFDFVVLKNEQEHIAKIILREHNTHVALIKLANEKKETGSPAEKLAAMFILSLPTINEVEYPGTMDGLIYGETISNQNANHSVSLLGEFWDAFYSGGNYSTRWVTKPDKIEATFRAEELLSAMAKSVYDNAEPGCHNNDWINLWSPYKAVERLTTSNPCSEYIAPINTSCNLSSFNAYRFLDKETKEINSELLEHGALLAMIVADLNIEEGGFPVPEIAKGTYEYRTTGIGFGNIGGLLMSLGIPYDSDEGRWMAATLTSFLTAACWKASFIMGREFGAYKRFEETKTDLYKVLDLHNASDTLLAKLPGLNKSAVEEIISKGPNNTLPTWGNINGRQALRALAKSFNLDETWDEVMLKTTRALSTSTSAIWKDVKKEMKVAQPRNSFVSLMAPGGTISAPLGIYDEGTTSAEPDYTLVKYKTLAGGGSLRMFNRLALEGLKTVGYSEWHVKEAAFEVAGLNGLFVACHADIHATAQHLSKVELETAGPVRQSFTAVNGVTPAWQDPLELARNIAHGKTEGIERLLLNGKGHVEQIPWLSDHHRAIFDCAATAEDGKRAIHASGHIKMLGALQPFISGATSKTVNLPYYATVEEIQNCFVQAHNLGVKCIALYRADSKGVSVYQSSSPEGQKWEVQNVWNNTIKAVSATVDAISLAASKPKRRKLPGRRWSQVVKFGVSGTGTMEGFLILGIYSDGTCGEIFGKLGQGGGFPHGIFESFCKAFSVMLQWGVPLPEAINTFKGIAFDPAGLARVYDPDSDRGMTTDIKGCKSVIDLLMQILAWMFPAENGHKIRGIESSEVTLDNMIVTVEEPKETQEAKLLAETTMVDLSSAEVCPECGSLSMIQDGKCKRCTNCGAGGGCGG